jgi:putative hemolysin
MLEINPLVMLVVLLVLLGLSAFFSGSETALMAISRLRLRHLAETKPRRARVVERILEKPERLIGAILVGNNVVNVLMAALATAVAIKIWGERGIVYVTAVLTFAILIFAEITPKVYAKYFNERVSLITAPILRVIIIVLNPLVTAVTYISNKILLVFGVDVSRIKRPLMTEAEVQTCIKMGWDEGAITAEERKILARVFTLNDRTVGEIMVPKHRMTTVTIESSLEDAMELVLKTGYTRFPVMEKGEPEIVGIVHAKDLFQLRKENKSASLKKILRPPSFVPIDRKVDVQLRSFQAKRLHQAVVLDLEGNVAGLVTLEDIVEELVGSIMDEHD